MTKITAFIFYTLYVIKKVLLVHLARCKLSLLRLKTNHAGRSSDPMSNTRTPSLSDDYLFAPPAPL